MSFNVQVSGQESNLYTVLEVSVSSSVEEIKASYQRLALIHHPDKSKDENAAETFRNVLEAWRILSDVETRAAYDLTIASADDVGVNAEEVALSDFELVGSLYHKICRCGGSYEVK